MLTAKGGHPVPMVMRMWRRWQRFLVILIFTVLAMRRVEATAARMQGLVPGPSRIFRVGGGTLYLFGWDLSPIATEAPSRIWEGVDAVWRSVTQTKPNHVDRR